MGEFCGFLRVFFTTFFTLFWGRGGTPFVFSKSEKSEKLRKNGLWKNRGKFGKWNFHFFRFFHFSHGLAGVYANIFSQLFLLGGGTPLSWKFRPFLYILFTLVLGHILQNKYVGKAWENFAGFCGFFFTTFFYTFLTFFFVIGGGTPGVPKIGSKFL